MDAKTVTLLVVLFVNQFYRATADAADCLRLEGITPEEEIEFRNFNLNSTEINPKLKCLTACFLEDVGAIDNCTFNYEAVQKLYSEEDKYQLGTAAEACKDSATGSERCECGFNVYKCVVEFIF